LYVYIQQQKLAFFRSTRARYFILSVAVINDPHQSPIRIKASVFYAFRLKHGPWFVSEPQKTFGAIPRPIKLSQNLWLEANPITAHGIGESNLKKSAAEKDGADDSNQT